MKIFAIPAKIKNSKVTKRSKRGQERHTQAMKAQNKYSMNRVTFVQV